MAFSLDSAVSDREQSRLVGRPRRMGGSLDSLAVPDRVGGSLDSLAIPDGGVRGGRQSGLVSCSRQQGSAWMTPAV